jgi:hypothetical protein
MNRLSKICLFFVLALSSVFAFAQSCPTIASADGTVANFTQLTGQSSVNYFGAGTAVRDVTSFKSVFNLPAGTAAEWPGGYGTFASLSVPGNKYVSLAFKVGPNVLPTADSLATSIYGRYTVGESSFTAPVSMTISTSCGDFSNPNAAGSTVLKGCILNRTTANNGLAWRNIASQYGCQIENGKSYYLNLINADITGVQPGGKGSAASYSNLTFANKQKNPRCPNGTCTIPVLNGYGSWPGNVNLP